MKLRFVTVLVTVLAVAGLAVSAEAQSKRPTVAVMDFDYSAVNNWWSGVWGNYDIGKGVADQVVDELINESDFRVIERKRIDTVLAEQDFQASDRADPHTQARIGKVLGVRYIIAGSITKFLDAYDGKRTRPEDYFELDGSENTAATITLADELAWVDTTDAYAINYRAPSASGDAFPFCGSEQGSNFLRIRLQRQSLQFRFHT